MALLQSQFNDHLGDFEDLFLSEIERVTGLEAPHLQHCDSGEVDVDTFGEQIQFARFVGQNLLDGANVIGVADGIDGDDGPSGWIGHGPTHDFTNIAKYSTKLLAPYRGDGLDETSKWLGVALLLGWLFANSVAKLLSSLNCESMLEPGQVGRF